MDYDYERYCEIVQAFMEAAWIDPDNLERGEDISDQPEVKIIFESYGDLEDEDENGEYRYTEGGNKDMECYAMFIHKDALQEGFVFPEHDVYQFTFGGMIAHRTKEEVCLYVWHDVTDDSWEVIQLEDRLDDDCAMDEEDVMKILEGLYKRYFTPLVDLKPGDVVGSDVKNAWPFPTGKKP